MRTVAMSCGWTACLAVGLPACGGGAGTADADADIDADSDSDGDADTDFCSQEADAWLDALGRCCGDVEFPRFDPQAVAERCRADHASPRLRFDRDLEEACVSRLRERLAACRTPYFEPTEEDACVAARRGLQAEGDPCEVDFECAEGLLCFPAREGACVVPVPLDGNCSKVGRCQTGATCDGSTCLPLPGDGESCASSGACAEGSVCGKADSCIQQTGDGGACTGSSQCASGHCSIDCSCDAPGDALCTGGECNFDF